MCLSASSPQTAVQAPSARGMPGPLRSSSQCAKSGMEKSSIKIQIILYKGSVLIPDILQPEAVVCSYKAEHNETRSALYC